MCRYLDASVKRERHIQLIKEQALSFANVLSNTLIDAICSLDEIEIDRQ